MVIDKDQSFTRLVTIFVPVNTKWQPDIAQQFHLRLFTFQNPLNLLIEATETGIRWIIEVARSDERALVKTLYTLYPQAQIEVKPKTTTTIGCRLYQLHCAVPFIAPIKYAEDFGKLDPLSAILGSMSDLQPTEILIYELSLRPPQQDYYKLGKDLLTTSTVKWWHFLTVDWTTVAAAKKATGMDKVDRYKPQIQKVARAKLNSPLKEVVFSVKIQAASKARSDRLIALLEPALATFNRDGFNSLVPAQKYSYPLVLSASELASLWHLPTGDCLTPGIIWAPSRRVLAPSPVIQNQRGVVLGKNRFGGRSVEILLPYPDRVAHLYICGRTSVGKSTLLHHIIHQDIEAGKGVAVLDPHGSLVRDILRCSIPVGREDDVVVVDFAETDHPPPLNPFAVPNGTPKEVAINHILGVLKKIFADDWSKTRMESAIYSSLVALLYEDQATPRDISRLFLNANYRHRLLKKVQDPVALEYWFDEFEQFSLGVQKQTREPVLNRIRIFYRNRSVRNMVCHPGRLDFRQIIEDGKIFLASLSSDETQTEQSNLGAMLIANFQMAAMSQHAVVNNRHNLFYMFIDEVQQFVTTALPIVLSEARKFGLSLAVANQYLGQLKGSTLEALLGNVGATVIFACGPDDARALAPFVRPSFTADDLINFDRFHTALKMQVEGKTMQAFSLNTLPPLPIPADANDREARIRQRSIEQYTPWTIEEVEAWLEQRYAHTKPIATVGVITDYD